MNLLNRTYLILAALFGIIGFVQCVRWSVSQETFGLRFFINFLPAAAFVLAYRAGRKRPQKGTHFAAIPLCTIAVVCWFGIALVVEIFNSVTTPITNTARYEEVVNGYWSFNTNLVAHFPSAIPPEASNVHFSFLPAFLQGGAHIQLRYSLPDDTISDLYQEFLEKTTKSFIGGNINDHINMSEGMPTTFFRTSGTDSNRFSDDYEIMIFDEVPEDRVDWNHGQSHGVAISQAKGEIVYWADSW